MLVNLPADLPIVQWLERCDNKETIIQSLKFEVIPPHSVVQSKGELAIVFRCLDFIMLIVSFYMVTNLLGEGVKRCMFILEGKILQCD